MFTINKTDKLEDLKEKLSNHCSQNSLTIREVSELIDIDEGKLAMWFARVDELKVSEITKIEKYLEDFFSDSKDILNKLDWPKLSYDKSSERTRQEKDAILKRLFTYGQKKGFSINEIASQVKISAQTIHGWNIRKVIPYDKSLAKVEVFLKSKGE